MSLDAFQPIGSSEQIGEKKTELSLKGHGCSCDDCLRLRGIVVNHPEPKPELQLSLPSFEPRNRAERRQR